MECQILTGSGCNRCPCRILLLVALVVAFAVWPSGASIIRMTLKDLVQKADLIVIGKVVKTSTAQTADGPRRLAVISVSDLLKGAAGDSVVISQPGGSVGRIEMVRSDHVPFESEEQVIVFLWTYPSGEYRVLGSVQGKILIVPTLKGEKNVILPPEPGKKTGVRITLTEFIQQVRTVLAEEPETEK